MIASLIALETVRVGVMGDVQPVPCPSFPIVGRSKSAINQPFPCIGRAILNKLIGLFWGWWNTQHVEAQSADQRFARGPAERLDAMSRHSNRKKTIDGVAILLAGNRVRWDLWILERLPCPVIQPRIFQRSGFPSSIGVYPLPNRSDLGVI